MRASGLASNSRAAAVLIAARAQSQPLPGVQCQRRPRRAAARGHPVGRIGGVGEIAAAVPWLASEEVAFVVGHDLVLDGGAAA